MRKIKNILVTGSNGQLGNELQIIAKELDTVNFFFTDTDTLDISSHDQLDSFFQKNKIDVCFNCAAYTAVDKAESDIELADLINNIAVEKLAVLSTKYDFKLLHISTDFVFDGENFQPYKESDATHPLGVYGNSKLNGENWVLKNEGIVIRTSWLYSSFGHNFVKTMLNLAKSRDELSVIFDQVGTPTYAADLAEAIFKVAFHENLFTLSGIYHYSNEGVASWYDFALAIFEFSEIDIKVNPIFTKEYPTPAKRPHYSVLDKSKIKSHFQIEIPYWRSSLKKCLKKLN